MPASGIIEQAQTPPQTLQIFREMLEQLRTIAGNGAGAVLQ
jgi:hypothetical protein